MAFGDNAFTPTMLEQTLFRMARLHPAKAQFARMGETSKWFRTQAEVFRGKMFHFYAFTTPSTGVRSSDFSTALSAAFPAASQPAYQELTYKYSDLTFFQGMTKFNEIADIQSDNLQESVFKLANRLYGGLMQDFADRHNRAIHTATNCQMGTVAAIYDEDGTSYSSGQADAFLQVTDGSIGQFLKGQSLKLNNSETVTVNDVIYGKDGPWSGGTRVSSIGPGIVVTTATSNLDGVQVTDSITMSGETTGDNYAGLPSWFSGTTNVYNDGDHNAIDRDSKGYGWSIPEIFDNGGSAAVFDPDTHLREVAEVLPFRVNAGRTGRNALGDIQSVEEGMNLPASLVAITTPSLAMEATTYAADSQRFMVTSSTSMDAAQRQELFGQTGFAGFVWHCPNLPPIAIVADKAARPQKINICDPQSWFYLTIGGQQINWLTEGNGLKLTRVTDYSSDDRPTFFLQAGAWTARQLVCDQPGANIEIDDVKSSTD